MRQTAIKYILTVLSWLAVLYPLWIRAQNVTLSFDRGLWLDLFPFFGIAAFCIMWLHVIGGALQDWLRRYVDLEEFVNNTSLVVFILMILHPVFLLIGLGAGASNVFFSGNGYIWLGVIGLVLLLTYDLGKAFKRRGLFIRYWNAILLISTIGFIFIFFHSLGLGSDLQAGPLRVLWIIYGATGIAATIYNYGLRRMFGPK